MISDVTASSAEGRKKLTTLIGLAHTRCTWSSRVRCLGLSGKIFTPKAKLLAVFIGQEFIGGSWGFQLEIRTEKRRVMFPLIISYCCEISALERGGPER